MKTFGFGQPPGIVQMAYVVPDIREAMAWWARECRAAAERAAYESRGYVTAFEAPVPSGGSVYYWRVSVEWKGDNPVRPFG